MSTAWSHSIVSQHNSPKRHSFLFCFILLCLFFFFFTFCSLPVNAACIRLSWMAPSVRELYSQAFPTFFLCFSSVMCVDWLCTLFYLADLRALVLNNNEISVVPDLAHLTNLNTLGKTWSFCSAVPCHAMPCCAALCCTVLCCAIQWPNNFEPKCIPHVDFRPLQVKYELDMQHIMVNCLQRTFKIVKLWTLKRPRRQLEAKCRCP